MTRIRSFMYRRGNSMANTLLLLAAAGVAYSMLIMLISAWGISWTLFEDGSFILNGCLPALPWDGNIIPALCNS